MHHTFHKNRLPIPIRTYPKREKKIYPAVVILKKMSGKTEVTPNITDDPPYPKPEEEKPVKSKREYDKYEMVRFNSVFLETIQRAFFTFLF